MLFASMSLVLVSSCGSIKIENAEVCSVKSFLQDGMFCAETLTQNKRELTFDEMVEFLEPNQDTMKGAALCMSLFQWNQMKTSLEQACELLDDRCTYNMKEHIQGLERIANETSLKSIIELDIEPQRQTKKCPSPNFGDCNAR